MALRDGKTQPLCSLEKIAKEIGVSRVQAGNIERRALKKFRKALLARGIDEQSIINYLRSGL